MSHRSSRAPLFLAVTVLLLPVLYVGSYFLLVIPGGRLVDDPKGPARGMVGIERPIYGGDSGEIFIRYEEITLVEWRGRPEYYRAGERFCRMLFWPLEELDRALRFDEWCGYPVPDDLDERSRRAEQALSAAR